MVLKVRIYQAGHPFLKHLPAKWAKIRRKMLRTPEKIEEYNIAQLQRATEC